MRTSLLTALFAFVLAASSRSQNVLFSDDFEQGAGLWTLTNSWRLADAADPCAAIAAPVPSGTHFLRWGRATVCDYFTYPVHGTATLATPVVLPSSAGSIDLSFATNSDTENNPNGEWDAARVMVSTDGGANWTTFPLVFNSPWYRHVYDLTGLAGQSVLVRFDFDAVDDWFNDERGWFIDDVVITARDTPGVPFCFGDWCPCSNFGSAGNGCATSINPIGGNLSSSGHASVGADDVVLTASGLTSSVVTFFQGTGTVFDAFYGATAFGDGRRCVSGSTVRLKGVLAQGGVAQYPGAGDDPISVRGMIPAMGGSRSYQVWYRSAGAFCTPSTFNLTNGLSVSWHP